MVSLLIALGILYAGLGILFGLLAYFDDLDKPILFGLFWPVVIYRMKRMGK